MEGKLLSWWTMKFSEKKKKKKLIAKRTSNVIYEWLFQIQDGIIYALLMRYHFVSEINYLSKTRVPSSICFNYSNGRYISLFHCCSLFVLRVRILREYIWSVLINRIFLLCLPSTDSFFVISLRRARWCIANSFSLLLPYPSGIHTYIACAKCNAEKKTRFRTRKRKSKLNIRETNYSLV